MREHAVLLVHRVSACYAWRLGCAVPRLGERRGQRGSRLPSAMVQEINKSPTPTRNKIRKSVSLKAAAGEPRVHGRTDHPAFSSTAVARMTMPIRFNSSRVRYDAPRSV